MFVSLPPNDVRLKSLNSWSYLKHAFFSFFHYPVKVGLCVYVYHGAIFWLFISVEYMFLQ
jgi:hypothetical protein